MGGKKKKYNARFPPARIKKIMQTDEEVGKIAAPVPVVISRALELFLESIITKSVSVANESNAKTLASCHIKNVIMTNKSFDFLKEQVTLVPDLHPDGGEGAAPTPPTDKSNKPSLDRLHKPASTSTDPSAPTSESGAPKKRPRSAATAMPHDSTDPSDPKKAIKRKRGRPPKVKQETNDEDSKVSTALPATKSSSALAQSSSLASAKMQLPMSTNGHLKEEPFSRMQGMQFSRPAPPETVARPSPPSIFSTDDTVLSRSGYSSPAAHSSSVMSRYPTVTSVQLQYSTPAKHTTIESMYNNLSPTSQPMDLSSKSTDSKALNSVVELTTLNNSSAMYKPTAAVSADNGDQAVNLSMSSKSNPVYPAKTEVVDGDDDYDAS